MQNEADREFVLAALDILLRGGDASEKDDAAAPLISVIMPVFNRPSMVQDALASLQGQTWRKFEVIAVDDGSTDETPEVLRRWAGKVPWLRVLTNETRLGVPRSRNRALAAATGEIVAYLDSDNLLYRNALASVADAFESPDTWSIHTSQLWVLPEGGLWVRCPNASLPAIMEKRDTFDLNAFAHRRALFDALGGFDERLTRFSDWELAIRYSKLVMPRRVPVPTGHYRHGHWPRVTNSNPTGWNDYLVRERHAQVLAHSLRVLYVVEDYPQVSEAHIVAELRFMQSRGVTIGIWSADEPAVPDPDLMNDDTVTVYRGSLADAIANFRPELLHVHLTFAFERHIAPMQDSRLPVTLRCHSFDVSADVLSAMQRHRAVRWIYAFPTQESLLPSNRTRVKLVPVCFDPGRYRPSMDKDRRLVFRAGAALPAKDIESFIAVAARCKHHRFVLFVCKTAGDREHLDRILAENERHGSPAEIHVDRPASEVATWMGRAGIYLHSYEPAKIPFGMPISIAEAMATGAYVLARRSEGGASYLGSSDCLYDTIEDAARLIETTLDWDERRWEDEARKSIDHAFGYYAPDVSAGLILNDWLSLTRNTCLAPIEADALPSIDANEAVFFGAGGTGVRMLRAGFHTPESWGVWAGSAQPSIAFATEGDDWSHVDALTFEAFAFGGSPGIPVRVWLNGRNLGTIALTPERTEPSIELGELTLAPRRVVYLAFDMPPPRSPADTGLDDRRRLSLALVRLSFRKRESSRATAAGPARPPRSAARPRPPAPRAPVPPTAPPRPASGSRRRPSLLLRASMPSTHAARGTAQATAHPPKRPSAHTHPPRRAPAFR
jgi:glycosyltransferase involved in cell wall biosynthesis